MVTEESLKLLYNLMVEKEQGSLFGTGHNSGDYMYVKSVTLLGKLSQISKTADQSIHDIYFLATDRNL